MNIDLNLNESAEKEEKHELTQESLDRTEEEHLDKSSELKEQHPAQPHEADYQLNYKKSFKEIKIVKVK